MSFVPWTFKNWIANFKDVDLPIGDLAKDILNDKDFPDDEDSYYPLISYIAAKSKYDARIIDTFRIVWDFYVLSTAPEPAYDIWNRVL